MVRRKGGFLLTERESLFRIVRKVCFEGSSEMGKTELLRNFLTNDRQRIKTVRKELKLCPIGHLYQQQKGGKAYFIQSYYSDGKKILNGISTKPDIVIGLIKRELLEKELSYLENNEKVVERCCKSLESFRLYAEIEKLKRRCPSVTDEMISAALRPESVSEWEQAEYEQSGYRVEERKQRTRNGLKVRSKSELLIAESLYDYSLPFRYEQVLYIQDKAFAPDFTILRPNGSVMYWEHFGLTNTKDYLEHQLYKLKMYASVNIVPWDNLIITFDDPSGNVDLRIIRSEIENKLI